MIFIILLGILSIVLMVSIVVMYRKIGKYEARINSIYDDLIDILKTLEQLDDKQIFEKDDEVGVLFTDIKKEIAILEKYFKFE